MLMKYNLLSHRRNDQQIVLTEWTWSDSRPDHKPVDFWEIQGEIISR